MCALDALELIEEVPVTRLCDDLIGCKDGHFENLSVWLGVDDLAAAYFVLLHFQEVVFKTIMSI